MSVINLLPRRTLCALLSGALCWGLSSAASADVYKYQDAYGRIHLTDQPMKGQVTLLKVYRMTPSRGPSANEILQRGRRQFGGMIQRVASEQGLHPELIHAVVRAESAYNPTAVSSKGAIGLMQLMPATADRLGVSDPRDPQQNLKGGAKYLRQLLGMFDNDLTLALAAYNAGENAVIRYGNQVPPYPETQNYVRKVQRFYQEAGGGSIERTLAVK